MKKLVIGLLIMLGVSTVGASASFGYVLKNEVKTYEVDEKYVLKKEALKNVYIESDIPFNVYETQGEPRIELRSKSIGVFTEEPGYSVDVREEGDASYIRISRNKAPMGALLLEDQEQLDIYLADQDVKTLEVKGIHGHINIAGNYGDVKVTQRYSPSTFRMDSTSPTKVVLEGPIDTELKGQFKDIEVSEYEGNDIRVESELPTNVFIEGNYHNYGGANIRLKGAYKNIDLDVDSGEVLFDLTTVPERVSVKGDIDNANIILPKDIKGFKLINKGSTDMYEEINYTHIYTDFNDTVQKVTETGEILSYGDQSTKLFIESYEGEINVLAGR